jgi:micrococcal nuclease
VSRINFTLEGSVLDVDDGDTLVLRASAVGASPSACRISMHRKSNMPGTRTVNGVRAATRRAARSGKTRARRRARRCASARRARPPPRAECYTIDAYGRPVCHVFVAGANLNLAQLRDGWAMLPGKRAWQRDPDSAAAEQAARGARRGLWAEARPEPPASWRTRCWCRGECTPRTH